MINDQAMQQAKKVLEIEAQAIRDMSDRLDGEFAKAVELLVACKGKVVMTGMGKSGHIAKKIASTLASTGTPSFFLHPAEGSHGDLGMISANDIVIAISYGGGSSELIPLIRHTARKNLPLIAMTGNRNSELARNSQVVLDIKVQTEACPLNLAPTASSTATLALGDALAMAVLTHRGFTVEHFAEFHPGGALGTKLLTRIRDVMHKGEAVPKVLLSTPLREILKVMTYKEVRGTAIVVDIEDSLRGVITDGDLRRLLERDELPINASAGDIMNRTPVTIDASELPEKALRIMEDLKIQMLVVTDSQNANERCPIGVIHFQDILKMNLR